MKRKPKQDIRELVGICGLYCGTCPDYLAYRENDVEQLHKISQETGIPVEEIRCDGCLSEGYSSLVSSVGTAFVNVPSRRK